MLCCRSILGGLRFWRFFSDPQKSSEPEDQMTFWSEKQWGHRQRSLHRWKQSCKQKAAEDTCLWRVRFVSDGGRFGTWFALITRRLGKSWGAQGVKSSIWEMKATKIDWIEDLQSNHRSHTKFSSNWKSQGGTAQFSMLRQGNSL